MLKRNPNCTRCRLYKTAEFVCLLGQGPIPCNVMMIGEAPGHREDESGTPFVGRSGKLLDEILEDSGFNRDKVFITNAVSCRPPENRKPKKSEIEACRAWLDYQVKAVKPKFVLIMGATAYESITGKPGIKSARGRPFEKDGITYLPTFHPSHALHDPQMEEPIRADFRLFKQIMDFGGIPRGKDLNYTSVTTDEDFHRMLDALKGVISFDIETTCLYPWAPEAAVTQIGFGTADGEFMIPCSHPQSPWEPHQVKSMIREIEKHLEGCIIVTHFGKFDYLWMMVHYNRWWHEHADFDTGLAHYALDENSYHSLKELARRFCGAPDWDIDDDSKKGLKGLDKLTIYHAHDLHYTRQLYYIFNRELKQDTEVNKVFHKILMPCLRLFTEIEYDGNCIDHTKFEQAEEFLENEIANADRDLAKYGNINWGSTQQLAKLLFDDLGIKPVEKTAGGSNSTSESVLKRIDHPIARLLMKRRAAKQQLSFFIEGWKPYIIKKPEGWFIHPSFKLHGTVTGRLSSEHPNWQQIPRDPAIRQLVTAPTGWTLIEADLEQIELKVAAEISQDSEMVYAFMKGIDVHWLTMITELERGGGGAYTKEIFQTAEMYLLQTGLPPYRSGAEILLKLLGSLDEGKRSYKKLQSLREDWANKESGSRERRKSNSQVEPILEGRNKSYLSGEVFSEKEMRAMQEFEKCRSASQRQGYNKQEKIKFADALQIVSRIGPSIGTELWSGWKEARKKAKAIGFGYLFGMYWRKFLVYARDNYDIVLTDKEAQESRKTFFAKYPTIELWHERQRKYARHNGYVKSLSGRKRRLPDAQARADTPGRREAERQAINSPVQSFANEINLMSVLQLREEFSRQVVRPVATVHDAILAWVRNDMIVPVVTRLLQIMSRPALFEEFNIQFGIPISAEAKIGPWSRGISFEKWKGQHEVQDKAVDNKRVEKVSSVLSPEASRASPRQTPLKTSAIRNNRPQDEAGPHRGRRSVQSP